MAATNGFAQIRTSREVTYTHLYVTDMFPLPRLQRESFIPVSNVHLLCRYVEACCSIIGIYD